MSVTLTISSGVLVVENFVPWPNVQSLTAGLSSAPSQITRDGPWTIVSVTGSGDTVQLPASAEVGDLFEVYDGDGAKPNGRNVILPSTGERIGTGVGSAGEALIPRILRKLSSTRWGEVDGE